MHQMEMVVDNITYSNEDFNFVVNSKELPLVPSYNTKQERIPYANRMVTLYRELDMYTIPVAISFLNTSDEEMERDILKFSELMNQDIRLTFYDSEYEFDVKFMSMNKVSRINYGAKEFELTFSSNTPYKYIYASPASKQITSTDKINIFNEGNEEAKPVITIDGAVSTITIGGFTINESNSGKIIIDTHLKEVYTVNNNIVSNIMNDTSGDFPVLKPVTMNEFDISGTGLNCTVKFEYYHTYR